jgi:hypothetical protein
MVQVCCTYDCLHDRAGYKIDLQTWDGQGTAWAEVKSCRPLRMEADVYVQAYSADLDQYFPCCDGIPIHVVLTEPE